MGANNSEYGLILLCKSKNNPIEIRKNISKCHILRAFLEETLRLACTAPMGLPHSTDKDVKVEIFNEKLQKNVTYCIPKGSVIFADQTSMNKKDKYWANMMDDPYAMNIDCWLDENG